MSLLRNRWTGLIRGRARATNGRFIASVDFLDSRGTCDFSGLPADTFP